MSGGDDVTADALNEELAELKQRIADGADEAVVDAAAKDLVLRASRRHIQLAPAYGNDPDEAGRAELDALDVITAEAANIRTDIVMARLANARAGQPETRWLPEK